MTPEEFNKLVRMEFIGLRMARAKYYYGND